MNYCLTLCEIHVEMKYLKTKAATINKNLEELGV